MRVWTRFVMAAAAGFTLVGAAGCSSLGSGAGAPPQPPKDELASVNPCSVLAPQELSASGLPSTGEPDTALSFKPGCIYDGDDFGVSIYKDTHATVDAIKAQSQWVKWDQVNVNGRPAVTAVNAGSDQARVCTTMFDAGKGQIDVQARTNDPGDNSQCQKSQEIAKQIEPRMPKKQ